MCPARRWAKFGMLRTTHDMTKINRDIWDLLPRLEAHVCGAQPQNVPLNAA